ncbi:hypothetical protein PRIPAC_78503 [Pristionchus pacificus]|uniref:N-acetyltransferase domain-containing protein n=1 Tax=Pristionchus pacificus TaxID=54126 RepID=A0A2A6C4E5_PRIPA|nr:hypothetical protein PRIPAC_78503 [Pristionchus pacificus]|eukprot:PDM72977.1 hypothetical protein PRIPAC_39411 [Pristionchus pacificus]
MTPLPTFTLVDEGNRMLWAGWAKLVRDNDWSSDDSTVIDLLPSLPSTRAVFAQDSRDGSFLGCVVWNEYDEMAFIGYYIVHPSMVGKGLGPKMWKRAFTRIPKHVNVGLRAVPSMIAKYAARDTPYYVSTLNNYELTVSEAREMCSKLEGSKHSIVNVEKTTDEQWEDLLEFDKDVTKRDSYAFQDNAATSEQIFVNSEERVVGYAAVSSTGYSTENKFKIGPVFASSINDALSMIRPLIDYCEGITPDAKILIKTLSGTVGERTLSALIDKEPEHEGTTLFKRPFRNTIDTDMCYIAHNHGGHFDA